MIPEFKKLKEHEIKLMIEAPVLITILIATADGNVEQKETDWGAKTIHFRAEDKESILQKYYDIVDKTDRHLFFTLMEKYPSGNDERINVIKGELSKLNAIFPKLEKDFAKELYKSFITLSKQVAKATGGIWGYGSISQEEQKLIDLEMIHPVI